MTTMSPSPLTEPAGPVFPQEIFELIVDTTSSFLRSPKTLSSLALVSRSLLIRCRGHLFHTVTFDRASSRSAGFSYPHPDSSKIQAFYALLQWYQGPEYDARRLGAPLGGYVHTIRVNDVFSPTLYRITTHLPNLKDIVIKTNVQQEDELEQAKWEAAHELLDGCNVGAGERYLECMRQLNDMQLDEDLPPLHLTRLYLRRTPPYRTWGVGSFNFIARLLQLQSRNLTYNDALFLNRANPWTSQIPFRTSSREVTVQRLDIHHATSTLRFFLEAEHVKRMLRALKELSVTLRDDETLEDPLKVAVFAQESLEKIEFVFSWRPYIQEPLVQISSLPHITQLSLVHYPLGPEQTPYSIPGDILDLLSSYADRNVAAIAPLVVVHLSLWWNEFDVTSAWDSEGTWSRLQKLILSPPFANLKQLKIRIDLSKPAKKAFQRHMGRDPDSRGAQVWEKIHGMFDLGDKLGGVMEIGTMRKPSLPSRDRLTCAT